MDYSVLYYVMQVIGILFFSCIIFYTIIDTITLALQRIKELKDNQL